MLAALRHSSRSVGPLSKLPAKNAQVRWVFLISVLCVFAREQLASAEALTREALGPCRKEDARGAFSNAGPNHGQFRILVTRFAGTNNHEEEFGIRVGKAIETQLRPYLQKTLKLRQNQLSLADLHIDYIRCALSNHEQARHMGRLAHADLVFWGQTYCGNCSEQRDREVNLNLSFDGISNSIQGSPNAKIETHINVPPPPKLIDAFKTSLTVVRWEGCGEDGARAVQVDGPIDLANTRLPRLASRRVRLLLDTVLGLYAISKGRHGLAVHLIDETRSDSLSIEGVQDLYRLLGKSLVIAGEPDRGLAVLKESHRLCRADDLSCQAETNYRLGWIYERQNQEYDAIAHYKAGLKFAQQKGRRWIEGAALNGLGRVLAAQGQFKQGQEQCEKGRQVCATSGARICQASSFGCLGKISEARGALAESEGHHQRALRISEQENDLLGEAGARASLAGIYAKQGDQKRSQESYERALYLSRQAGDRRGTGLALSGLAEIAESQGNRQKAFQLYNEALPELRAAKDSLLEPKIRTNLDRLSRVVGLQPVKKSS